MLQFPVILLSGLFAFLYFILILLFLYGWNKIKFYNNSSNKTSFNTFASIIIAARNEEKNIKNLLTDLSKQNFDPVDFEIIVVNDNSDDLTYKYVCDFCLIQPNLKLINLSETNLSGKKQALISGINKSKGKLIITIDADCRLNDSWLSAIISFYENFNPKMIVAPVIINEGVTIFHKFQSLEFSALIGSTAGAIGIGKPILCNGANLAFEKETFYEFNDPFENSVISGDDVLFMHKIKKKYKNSVFFLKSQEALVRTNPQNNLKDFVNQRIRWVSKSKHYQDADILITSFVVFLFNFSILTSFALLWFDFKFVYVFIFIFIFKTLLDGILFMKISSFFNNKRLIFLILPFEFIYVLYIVIIGILGNFLTFEWKKRFY